MNKPIDYYGLSIQGRRSSNQDRYLCSTINGITVLAVADGMGGHYGGEIASQLAIDSINEILSEGNYQTDLKTKLNQIYQLADKKIKIRKNQDQQLAGMGTTLSVVLMENDDFVFGSIGDSRIYRKHDGEILCLTKDHSYLQEYIDKYGVDVPQEILKSKHLLTKALTGDGDKYDIFPSASDSLRLLENELFILLSDGAIQLEKSNLSYLNDYLLFVNSTNDLCKEIIKDAYESGSTDNCTVVVGSRGDIKSSNKTLYVSDSQETFKVTRSISKNRLIITVLISLFIITSLLVILVLLNDGNVVDKIERLLFLDYTQSKE
jgi:protein phosphatase